MNNLIKKILDKLDIVIITIVILIYLLIFLLRQSSFKEDNNRYKNITIESIDLVCIENSFLECFNFDNTYVTKIEIRNDFGEKEIRIKKLEIKKGF